MPGGGRRSCLPLLALALVLVLFLCRSAPAAAQRRSKRTSPWLTLTGNAPLSIANGGHSGLFPDSSIYAYFTAQSQGLPNTVLWCDVQLTKDGVGICLPDVNMNNCTNVADVYPKKARNYLVNGVSMTGWFPLDYKLANLSQVHLTQGIYSRTPLFDGLFPILTVEDLESRLGQAQLERAPLWLNIQHDMFYSQHNLSMSGYLLSITRRVIIDYVSSPEVSFLRSIAAKFKGSKTQLIFRFLEAEVAEPSTNQTYDSLSKNLTFIKTFASGILLPKNYIWPVTSDGYLQSNTLIVLDAHKAGLQVFAADFANDNIAAYNYSYDPIAEYLSFVDNGVFSVDGVLSDSPVTASEAIGCFSHLNWTKPEAGNIVAISYNGASGKYPGCTDLAYNQAIDDGADYIDCPVQVTKDGVLICMDNINLILSTTAAKSRFNTLSSIFPEIQSDAGIFTFNLTWEEIQTNLKPQISTPFFLKYQLLRNPASRNAGSFMTLTDFLAFAKDKALRGLRGILISIEHAAFLAEKLGFSVTDAVVKALSDSGYENQTNHKVIIQSSNSSVLMKLRQQTRYELMYKIDENIGDAVSSSIKEISEFAHSVAIRKQSIYPESQAFIVGKTDLVPKFHAANLSVYAYLFLNEFVSQAWDFFSDSTAEVNTYAQDAGVNGFITSYPRTVAAYRRNTCLNLGNKTPTFMLPVEPAGLDKLLKSFPDSSIPPALPPLPLLTDADVVEPPLPPPTNNTSTSAGGAGAPAAQPPSGQPSTSASISPCLAMVIGFILLI